MAHNGTGSVSPNFRICDIRLVPKYHLYRQQQIPIRVTDSAITKIPYKRNMYSSSLESGIYKEQFGLQTLHRGACFALTPNFSPALALRGLLTFRYSVRPCIKWLSGTLMYVTILTGSPDCSDPGIKAVTEFLPAAYIVAAYI